MPNTFSTSRLAALEAAIKGAGCDLYLVPMVDEFQGEYTPPYAARLPYVTGFTGSAGLGAFWAAATEQRKHTLFVDGRYTLQAANEVDTAHIDVLNSGDVTLTQWLASVADTGLRVGIDPWLVTMQQQEKWQIDGVSWSMARPNLVDSIWTDQPKPPAGEVVLHPVAYAGKSYAEKREALAESFTRHRADALLLTAADAINWLLNLRGADIAYNPLLLGYFLLTRDGKGTLYTYPHSFSAEVKSYLKENNVTLASMDNVFNGKLTVLPSGARVMMDPATTPFGWHVAAHAAGWEVVAAEDPTQLPKAIKNPTELAGIRAAHMRDGLALTRFLQWFERRASGRDLPDELTVVAQLDFFRAQSPDYRGPSFATIAGSGPNGAIIHYRADEKSNRRTRPGELFLLDSGGQYPDGTTDVTRTFAVGTSSPAMREHFTRVLKGHIALASVRFPAGTSGSQLDVLARQFLWEAGLDFDHGTGHGVGAYLCVHEGPQRISKRGSCVPLVPGMIISNEPGYYAQGEYGIRIESLVAVVEAGTVNGRAMYQFETLTLAPIDTRLIELSLLTSAERNWLNSYHRRVYTTHAPKLARGERDWLTQVTRAI